MNCIMSSESQRPFVNGHTNGHANGRSVKLGKTVEELNSELGVAANDYQAEFHGDELLGDKQIAPTGTLLDIRDVFTWGNARQIWEVLAKKIAGQGLDVSTLQYDRLNIATSIDLTGFTDGRRLTACRLFTGEQREPSCFHPEPSHCKIQQDAAPATYLPG